MDVMMVEERDYRFTIFLALELSLVAERAAFPSKCYKRGLPNIARTLPVAS